MEGIKVTNAHNYLQANMFKNNYSKKTFWMQTCPDSFLLTMHSGGNVLLFLAVKVYILKTRNYEF